MFDCNPDVTRASWRAASIACLYALIVPPASSEEIVVSIDQGTNMALALAPDHQTLIVDLMGQLWSLPVTGGAAQPLLPPEESARNPRFSPDGSHLVYQQYSRGQWDLWLIEIASGSRRRLTGPPYDEREPDFAEDGRSIVFVSNREGASGLFRIRLATETVTALPRATGHVAWPSVSERGEIAFVDRLDDMWALRLLRLDGSVTTLVTSAGPIRAPSWRPGGGVIMFTEQPDLDSSNLRMVVLGDDPVVKTLTRGEDVFGFRAAWTSAAEFIYTADGRIWRRTIGSTTRRAIPLFAGIGVEPAPSNLKSTIVSAPGPHTAQGIRGLRVAPTNGSAAFTAIGDLWLSTQDGELRQLTNDRFVDIDPVFTPDGDRLVFASDRAGTMDLWSLTLDSGELDRLTTGPDKAFSPAVSPDGSRIAYLATSGFGPWAPSELRLISLNGSGRPQTIARELYDAGNLTWDASNPTISVWARDRDASGGATETRRRLEIDPEGKTEVRNRGPRQPGRTLPADPEFARPTWTPQADREAFVIQVDRLFDGVGTQYRRYMDIHVEGRRISAVVARGLRPLPDKVVDARRYTALPGLIDLHAHQAAIAGERLGRTWLAYGVTTVREVSSNRDDGLERKEAWESGRRLGPRLLLSARHTEASGWHRPADAVRPAYDVLEIYRGQPDQLSRVLIREARQLGIPIFSEDLFPALGFGISGLEHIGGRTPSPYELERSALGRSYADVTRLLLHSGATVTPMLGAFGGFGQLETRRSTWSNDPGLRRLFTDDERSAWRSAPPSGVNIEELQRTAAALVRAGARVTAGSDAPSVPYGLGLHAEIALLAEAGIPNDQALRLVTGDAALTLGLERDVGTIEAGRLADLVIVDGNPLTTIRDTLNIVAVVKDGIWYDRNRLLEPE